MQAIEASFPRELRPSFSPLNPPSYSLMVMVEADCHLIDLASHNPNACLECDWAPLTFHTFYFFLLFFFFFLIKTRSPYNDHKQDEDLQFGACPVPILHSRSPGQSTSHLLWETVPPNPRTMCEWGDIIIPILVYPCPTAKVNDSKMSQ